MTDQFPVVREDNGDRGRFAIYLPDGSVAEMTYQRRDAKTIIADHTGVPPQYRNQGVALKLVEDAMVAVRAAGEKVVPTCSYVVAQFRRHPDWADLHA